MKRTHGLLIADEQMLAVGPILLVAGAGLTFTPLAGGFFVATLGGFIFLGSMAPHRTRHRVGDPVAFVTGLGVIGAGIYLPYAGLGRFSEIVLLVGTMLAFAGFFFGKEKEEPEVVAWPLYRTPSREEREAAAESRRRAGYFRTRHGDEVLDRRPASPGAWLFPPDTDDDADGDPHAATDREPDPDTET